MEKYKKNKDMIPEPETVERSQVYSVHRAKVQGENNGETRSVIIDIIQEPHEIYEGYSGPLTGMSASIGAQMLGQGKIQPGVWAPEECIDPHSYFEELKKRKFKIKETVEKSL